MAKGKYAARAEVRNEQAETTALISAYQEKIVRLTKESQDLRDTLDRERSAYKKAERRLRAERDEGVAPQVVALKIELRKAHAERDEAQRGLARDREAWQSAASRLTAHLRAEYGLTGLEATELLLSIMSLDGKPAGIIYGVVGGKDIAPKRLEALQRARGLRR